jgi:ketosteroid isomerase-like protein
MATLSARYSRALRALENDRDLQPLIELFAEDAEVSNPLLPQTVFGTEAVRKYWRSYLDRFAEIKSEFLSFVDARDASALEWISTGRLADGRPVEYSGSTVLISQDERITRMNSYFDPRPLLGETRREPTLIRRAADASGRKSA